MHEYMKFSPISACSSMSCTRLWSPRICCCSDLSFLPKECKLNASLRVFAQSLPQNAEECRVWTSSLVSAWLSAVASLGNPSNSYILTVVSWKPSQVTSPSESSALVLCLLLNKVPLDFILPIGNETFGI